MKCNNTKSAVLQQLSHKLMLYVYVSCDDYEWYCTRQKWEENFLNHMNKVNVSHELTRLSISKRNMKAKTHDWELKNKVFTQEKHWILKKNK